MTDSRSLEKLIGSIKFDANDTNELKNNLNFVLETLEKTGRVANDDQIVAEIWRLFFEKTGKTVLVSETDTQLAESLKVRLGSEHFRVLPLNSVDELKKYYDDSLTGQFNLVGVIAGYEKDEGNARHVAVKNILLKTKTECVALSHREAEFNTSYLNYPAKAPPPVLDDHQKIERIFKELRLAEQQTTHETARIRIDWQDNKRDTGKLYADALWKQKKGMWNQAVESYAKILKINKYEIRAFVACSGLLLRKKMRDTGLNQIEQYFGKNYGNGIEGLISFLQEKKRASAVTELDYLLGKALTIQYHERMLAAPADERKKMTADSSPIIHQALKHFDEYLLKDVRANNNLDALAYLSYAYILEGSRENKDKAHSIIQRIIKNADPISDQLTSQSNIEFEIMQIFDRRDLNVQGSRLMQLAGLNRVFELCDDLVVKKYKAPANVKRATNECNNLNDLSAVADNMKIHIGSHDQFVGLPGMAFLLHGPDENTETPHDVFEVMPRLQGRQLANIFEDLNTLTQKPAAMKELKTSIDEIKISHLEWAVDSCARLQTLGTQFLDLEDIRKNLYKVKFGNVERTVGFYTKRAITKVIEGEYRPTVHGDERKSHIYLNPNKKGYFKNQINKLEKELRKAPEWLWLFYTDSNLRNYLVSPTSDAPNIHEELVLNSKKSRVDLENRDKRLGIGDVVTAVEHELTEFTDSKRGVPELTESRRVAIDYLVNRWLAKVIIEHVPPYWEHNKIVPGEKLQAYNDFKQKVETILEQETNGKKKSGLREALSTYLPRIEPGFTLDKFRHLHYVESLLRHMTIVGDKDSELELVEKVTKEMKSKYPTDLQNYNPLGSFKQEYDRLDKLEGNERQDNYQVLKSYSKYCAYIEDLRKDREHHFKMVKTRLNDLKLSDLQDFLAESIGWKGVK
jgi:hypothetical protein